MKDVKNYSKWMSAASELLTPNELKVFVQWYGDAPNFSAGATIISERLPLLDAGNIRRAFVSMAKKRFLKDSGIKKKNEHGSATTLYILGDLEEVCKLALSKRVATNTLKCVDNEAKCVDICPKCVDSYPLVCSCRGDSVLVATHVLINSKTVSTVKQKTTDSFENAQTPLGLAKEEKVEQINQPLVNEQDHEYMVDNSSQPLAEEYSDLVEKLEYVIENDTRPGKNGFPSNQQQSQNLLAKIKNGSKLTPNQIQNIERMYEFCPVVEVKENEDPRLFKDNPIDRSMFEGLPPVNCPDDENFLKILEEIGGKYEAV